MSPLSPPAPARPAELAPAARLAFGHLPPAERDARTAGFLRLIESGDLDPQGIFVLRGPHELRGTMFCAPVAGAGALVWPPACAPDEDAPGVEDALVTHALTWLRGRAVKVVQALLGPGEEALGAPLVRHGLLHVTNLWYLRRPAGATSPFPASRLTYEPFAPDAPGLFEAIHARTFEDTLDCPELNGVRTSREILAGHRAQGLFDPNRWLLARAGGTPVGVALVVEVPETGEWELAYMGLVPEVRGGGLGAELLGEVLSRATAAGAPAVLLSVDARNTPAWGLYRRVGFEPTDRRAVHLLVWR